MMLPVYNFYCGDCHKKTKAVLFFRTWCPCGESSVMATARWIEYEGMAIDQETWEKMDEVPNTFIGPINLKLLLEHK